MNNDNAVSLAFSRLTGVDPFAGILPMLEGPNPLRRELLENPDEALDLLFADGGQTEEEARLMVEPLVRQYWVLSVAQEKLGMLRAFQRVELPEGYNILDQMTREKHDAWDKQGLFVDAVIRWADLPHETSLKLRGAIELCFEGQEIELI